MGDPANDNATEISEPDDGLGCCRGIKNGLLIVLIFWLVLWLLWLL